MNTGFPINIGLPCPTSMSMKRQGMSNCFQYPQNMSSCLQYPQSVNSKIRPEINNSYQQQYKRPVIQPQAVHRMAFHAFQNFHSTQKQQLQPNFAPCYSPTLSPPLDFPYKQNQKIIPPYTAFMNSNSVSKSTSLLQQPFPYYDDRSTETPNPPPVICELGTETPSTPLSSLPSFTTPIQDMKEEEINDFQRHALMSFLHDDNSTKSKKRKNSGEFYDKDVLGTPVKRYRRSKAEMAADRLAANKAQLKDFSIIIKRLPFTKEDMPVRIFGFDTIKKIKNNVEFMKITPTEKDYTRANNMGYVRTQKGIILSCLTETCAFKTYDGVTFEKHLYEKHDKNDITSSGYCFACDFCAMGKTPAEELMHLTSKHIRNQNLKINEILYSQIRLPKPTSENIDDISENIDDTSENIDDISENIDDTSEDPAIRATLNGFSRESDTIKINDIDNTAIKNYLEDLERILADSDDEKLESQNDPEYNPDANEVSEDDETVDGPAENSASEESEFTSTPATSEEDSQIEEVQKGYKLRNRISSTDNKSSSKRSCNHSQRVQLLSSSRSSLKKENNEKGNQCLIDLPKSAVTTIVASSKAKKTSKSSDNLIRGDFNKRLSKPNAWLFENFITNDDSENSEGETINKSKKNTRKSIKNSPNNVALRPCTIPLKKICHKQTKGPDGRTQLLFENPEKTGDASEIIIVDLPTPPVSEYSRDSISPASNNEINLQEFDISKLAKENSQKSVIAKRSLQQLAISNYENESCGLIEIENMENEKGNSKLERPSKCPFEKMFEEIREEITQSSIEPYQESSQRKDVIDSPLHFIDKAQQNNAVIINLTENESVETETKPSKKSELKDFSNLYPWMNEKLTMKYLKSEDSHRSLFKRNCLFASCKCMSVNCSYYTNSLEIFEKHLKLHQENSLDEHFLCSYCLFDGASVAELINHIKTLHLNNVYQCGECMYRACERVYCILHIEQYHKNHDVLIYKAPVQTPTNRENRKIREIKNQSLKPEIEESFFQVVQNFSENVNYLTTLDSLECLYCQFRTGDDETMKLHLLNIHASEYAFVSCRRRQNEIIDVDEPGKLPETNIEDFGDHSGEILLTKYKGSLSDLLNEECHKIINPLSDDPYSEKSSENIPKLPENLIISKDSENSSNPQLPCLMIAEVYSLVDL